MLAKFFESVKKKQELENEQITKKLEDENKFNRQNFNFLFLIKNQSFKQVYFAKKKIISYKTSQKKISKYLFLDVS